MPRLCSRPAPSTSECGDTPDPPGTGGSCNQGSTYTGSNNQVCGSLSNWGQTQLEVWRLVTAEELAATEARMKTDDHDVVPSPFAAAGAEAGAAGTGAAAAGADAPGAFPESRIITPAQGAQLNSWANQTAGRRWELCYTSFTMVKTVAEFHSRCDKYTPTVSVAHNSLNHTFGGFVRLPFLLHILPSVLALTHPSLPSL